MSAYFLPHHVHICRRGDDFVFLDLRQDEYTLVNGGAAAALRGLTASRSEPAADAPALLQELLAGGLLTQDAALGRTIAVTRAELAVEPLVDPEVLPETRLRLHHLWRFVSACLAASLKLRWQRLEDTVAGFERRKSAHGRSRPLDLARARELTAVFLKLRSFFPADHLCLYDSLALLEFLARYRVFPRWVFGIKLEPWAAHCWVQDGPCVFNEDVEVAAGYTPIMAI